MTDAEIAARVVEILKLLDLSDCADTLIKEPGLPGGISGGQLRRLEIATMLLRNPSVLLLGTEYCS